MWVEKYRPREFNEVVGLNPSISKYIQNNEIPHLLFYGTAGVGKTTTALIIVNKLGSDVLMLNASDERKIETIRNKVKAFASTVSSNGKLKIVFLDEADALTSDAQNALRNMMETYYNNCRFILTCNYINKISEPIKSRCQLFKFELSKKEDIKKRLSYIISQEKVEIEDKALDRLIEINYPDIRSMINKLEALHNGKLITINDIEKESLLVKDLFDKLKNERLSNIRQWILDNNIDYNQILIDMSNYIWNNLQEFGTSALKILMYIADTNYRINIVVDKEIEFTNLLLKIKQTFN